MSEVAEYDPYNEGLGTRSELPNTPEAVLLEAARLIRKFGHATNEACHREEFASGVCVGWGIAVSARRIAPTLESDLRLWSEARRFMAQAWGFPFDWATYGNTEEAAVPANEYAVEHGIDPVPYIENAAALAAGRSLPHPGLPALLDAWPKCPGCGRPSWDGEFCSEACLRGGT